MADKKAAVKPIEKRYYDVKVDCLLPATLTYRVLAENPEEALRLTKNMSPVGVKHKLAGRRELEAKVYDMGSSMIRLVKKLMGR